MLQINYSEIIVIVIMVIIIIVISSYNTSEIRGFLSDSLSQAWTFFFFSFHSTCLQFAHDKHAFLRKSINANQHRVSTRVNSNEASLLPRLYFHRRNFSRVKFSDPVQRLFKNKRWKREKDARKIPSFHRFKPIPREKLYSSPFELSKSETYISILFRLKSRRFIGCCAHSATIFVITFSPQRAALLRYNSIAIPLLLNATIYNVRFRVAFMCPHVTPMRTIYSEFHESSPRRGRRSNRAPHLSSAYVPVYSYRLKPSRVT